MYLAHGCTQELDSSESIRRSMCQQQSARIAAAQEDAASGREMPVAQIEADAINLEDGGYAGISFVDVTDSKWVWFKNQTLVLIDILLVDHDCETA